MEAWRLQRFQEWRLELVGRQKGMLEAMVCPLGVIPKLRDRDFGDSGPLPPSPYQLWLFWPWSTNCHLLEDLTDHLGMPSKPSFPVHWMLQCPHGVTLSSSRFLSLEIHRSRAAAAALLRECTLVHEAGWRPVRPRAFMDHRISCDQHVCLFPEYTPLLIKPVFIRNDCCQ